jgi:hypothetical protein
MPCNARRRLPGRRTRRRSTARIVLLGILGVGDLAMVPFMIAANHHTAGTPPMPAIVVAAIIGVATLINAVGVAGAAVGLLGGDDLPDHRLLVQLPRPHRSPERGPDRRGRAGRRPLHPCHRAAGQAEPAPGGAARGRGVGERQAVRTLRVPVVTGRRARRRDAIGACLVRGPGSASPGPPQGPPPIGAAGNTVASLTETWAREAKQRSVRNTDDFQ